MYTEFLYGKGCLNYDIPEKRYAGTLSSGIDTYQPEKSGEELIQEALDHPIGCPRLSELAKGKKNIVIITSDHTRPVPSSVILPKMLREIRSTAPDADVTILVATGCHRATTDEELRAKLGMEICDHEKIVIHDCDDEKNLVHIGKLPSGGDLIINRIAAEADLLAADGFIEPHFFAGFSGGRKSVLPGICSRKTVLYNHCSEFIDSERSRTGITEGNPIHKDMEAAALAARLAFICNVVLNSDKEIVYAAAGDPVKAHLAGIQFLKDKCSVDAVPADIVISTNGGYPLDQNVYQSVKGMTAAEACVRKGGVIIMLAKADDGIGGEYFYRMLRENPDNKELYRKIMATPAYETEVDQWQVQVLLRVLMKTAVIYVSETPDEKVREMHMIPAHSLDEAVQMADTMLKAKKDRDGSILAIPDGIAVYVVTE